MYTIKEKQRVDRELFSELIESPVNPTFLNMTRPFTLSLNPLFYQQRSSLGMASTKKSWRSIWCSPVQFEDSCHWRHRLGLSGIQNVTNHTISKFREELIKDRSRYIEKVTGNGVLLIAINACLFVMFVEEERYIPKIASPQKLRLGKSLL